MNINEIKYKFNNIFFDKIAQDTNLNPNNYAIAGGALRDSLIGDRLKDIDIFCVNKEAVDVLDTWFVKQDGVKIMHGNNILSNYKLNGYWFQIIKDKFFDLSDKSLIESFDFSICGIMMHNNEIRVTDHFFEDIATHRLRIQKIPYPLSTLERLQKYIKKGYHACNGTILEIAKAIQSVDLQNPAEDTLRFYPDGTPRFFGVD